MAWTALVPLKQAGFRKSRLDARLPVDDRTRLGETLTRHVIDILLASPTICSVILLSDVPLTGLPVRWMPDAGNGLNAEVGRAAATLGNSPLLIVQGDLPGLKVDDVTEMTAKALPGASIAPDRHGLGTNALALRRPEGFSFAFGANSLAAHLEILGTGCEIVRRPGLAFDIDTASDLDEAFVAGLISEIREA